MGSFNTVLEMESKRGKYTGPYNSSEKYISNILRQSKAESKFSLEKK